MKAGKLLHGMLAVALVAASMGAASAEWTVQSTAQVFARVESNPRLLADDERGAEAGVADLTLVMKRSTEVLDLAINAHGNLSRYNEDVSLDRDEQQVDATLQRLGERYSLSANLTATRDTTLTSELGSTGLIEDNLRHTALSAGIAPMWQLTERTSAGASLGWQQSHYAQNTLSGLVDYQYRTVGVNVARNVNEKGTVSLVASAGRLSSDGPGFDTDNIDLRLQARYVWSPRWQGSISGGPSRVQTDTRKTNGSVLSATLTRSGELFSLDAKVGRSIVPTGRGFLSRRDDAGLQLRAALRENLEGAAYVSMVRTRDHVPQFGFTFSDVRYLRAEMSLSWRFTQDWSLGLAAGSSEQRLMFDGATGRSVDGRLQLVWRRAAPVG